MTNTPQWGYDPATNTFLGHSSEDVFFGTAGPRDAKIVLVAEAWGAEEALHRTPLIGQSGREMFRMLGEALKIEPELLSTALAQRKIEDWKRYRDAWLHRASILLCNVIAARPPSNDFTYFLYSNEEAKLMRKGSPHVGYFGVYPKPELARGIRNLWSLIDRVSPKLVIACGNWPLHILTSHAKPKTTRNYRLPTGISSWRGSQTYLRRERGSLDQAQPDPVVRQRVIPCLPIIHPAAILRDWSMRHVTVHDLRARAGRYITDARSWEAPPHDDRWAPSFDETIKILDTWYSRVLRGPLWLSVDLETFQKKFISCLGLCDAQIALCIPFFYFDKNQRCVSYFSLAEETTVWLKLRELLSHPNCWIIGQNFIYDTQYLARCYGIEAIVVGETMVGHHLLFPGTPKDLATLASLYNDHFCYWKDEGEEWAVNEMSAQELWKYNCKDTRATYEAWFQIWKLICRFGFEEKYATRMEAWKLARKMTLRGINYDATLRNIYLSQLSAETQRLESWLLNAVPESLRYTSSGKAWFASAPGTMNLLYSVIGLKPILHKKTKQPTSDDSAINILCERPDAEWLSPLLERLRDLRSALVSARNFLSVTLDMGRFTPQSNIAQPETFRWSTKDNAFGEGGSVQNLPKMED
jgi:uracil-DNA glycosylase